MSVLPDGRVRLAIGTQSNGQGHATAYAQLLAEGLGVPLESVETIQGDTDLVATGRGTGGSRSVPVGGPPWSRRVAAVVARAKALAAEMLETAEADLEFAQGVFTVLGTDRRVTLFEVARARRPRRARCTSGSLRAADPHLPQWLPRLRAVDRPCDRHPAHRALHRGRRFRPGPQPFAAGRGQVHGGIAQGVGQALLEEAVYDHDSGQLLAGSFMDYAMPRADSLPPIDFSWIEVPCTTNPLGMKGAGEAGAIGAPPAVINAVVDAFAEFGVRHVDMPATPQKLWRLITQS